MPWYIYSILSSLSFTGMVLCTRYLGNKKFSSKQILLFIFGFTFLGFLILNAGTLNNIWGSKQFPYFLIVMAITGLFCIIGNWADFTAVIKAPNPGFVGAIKNSNVLLIVFISTLFFGSSLNMIKLLGVLLTVGGIVALVAEKKVPLVEQDKKSLLGWDILAAIGALSFAIMVLGVKKVSLIGFSSQQINLFLCGLNFLAFAILSRKEIKGYFQNTVQLKSFLPIVFLASTFSFVANLCNIKGIAVAPNPGYHESIKNTQILLTTLISVPLFGVKLKRRKLLGVVFVLIGVVILVI